MKDAGEVTVVGEPRFMVSVPSRGSGHESIVRYLHHLKSRRMFQSPRGEAVMKEDGADDENIRPVGK